MARTLHAVAAGATGLRRGHRLAAVGVGDSHDAGRSETPLTQASIGEATTVVRAEELSEPGTECGVEAGHTYVKVTGNRGPDLRLEAEPTGGPSEPATFGDTRRAGRATFRARVLGGAGRTLLVVRDGVVARAILVRDSDFAVTSRSLAPAVTASSSSAAPRSTPSPRRYTWSPARAPWSPATAARCGCGARPGGVCAPRGRDRCSLAARRPAAVCVIVRSER